MPNYSSSSVDLVDWAMGFDGCPTPPPMKKRNLLDHLQVLPESIPPTPLPPPIEDFISLINTKKRTHTCASLSSLGSNDSSFYLPHQTSSPLLDYSNFQYAKIRARPLYNFKYNESNIWTQTSPNSINPLLNDLSFETNLVNKFFAKETARKIDAFETRSRTSSISTIGVSTRPYQILDKSSQITYDVAMRHLLQLLAKDHRRNATIDDVLRGIETGSIDAEWLQCVQRLTKALHKQFVKRPADELKFKNFNMDEFDSLNLVEQFFVKLLRQNDYKFKLKSYQYRDEFQSQLIVLHQSIERFIRGIDLVLHDRYLPWIFQLLCFLYNLLSNKSVPGLDLNSLGDALNSPTNQTNKTVAHVLAQILDDHYPEYLRHIVNDDRFVDLKKIFSVNYDKLFDEVREIYQQFRELEIEYDQIRLRHPHHSVPFFVSSMLEESKRQFDLIFAQENQIEKGEEDLAAYFCSNELTLNMCLSSVAHFVDKLRLAHLENQRSKKFSR